jgi:iron complex outermembrane receptor protein
MSTRQKISAATIAISVSWLIGTTAIASAFNIPGGTLAAALEAYSAQSGLQLAISSDGLAGTQTKGVSGEMTPEQALSRILSGTGFTSRHIGNSIAVIRASADRSENETGELANVQLAAATASAASGAALETVTVTSSKIGGDVQNIPISITAMSQEQLTQTQTAGGPDLVKQVPNLTFSKTNFTGYNIEIRGIGTQAISVTTDPAVAVAFNDIPFIRNHFFEQEFYDVSQVEVLRGPQGTLYGRNATAGVVNLVSAKPTDQYEAMASLDVGNYENRRLEGMLNVPIIGDKLDLRLAGEWTKRDGYALNEETGQNIDGRDLWSGRVSLLAHPFEKLTANVVWEHFSEDDDRMRSTKQLCTRDARPATIDGPDGPLDTTAAAFLSQGCKSGPLYGPTAFQTPDVTALPFIYGLLLQSAIINDGTYPNPYANVTQSQNLRVIDSSLEPKYKAKNDTFELNVDYSLSNDLTLTSQTGFNKDSLYSTEDYNRFNTASGLFNPGGPLIGLDGEFCDPQLGCSSKLIGEDISQERAQQFSQELRLASNFSGPLNFSAGANYLHYQTVEDYYVFYNAFTMISEYWSDIFGSISGGSGLPPTAEHMPFNAASADSCGAKPATPDLLNASFIGLGCEWVDPNPLDHLDGQGHNYFLSQNPYHLNSWAGFGEVYYQLTPDVKLTGGLRWTDDRKEFVELPSWALFVGKGFYETGVLDQEWKEWTGRFNATWTPKLDFTDQSLFYGSYSRGYKGGGANPPGVMPACPYGYCIESPSNATHPLTFKPEFVDAFEAGTKNTLLDGAMTFNADVFFYKYQNYQISQIVDRTSVNLNFNAHVKGAEAEATWEPAPGLRFNISGGYEDATLDSGSEAIDLMDRTAGDPAWTVVRPFYTQTSNCIIPTATVYNIVETQGAPSLLFACSDAYGFGSTPPGSTTAPNNGQGIDKNLSGNQLPNAPPFTLSAGAQYSMPVSSDWAATGRVDGYWQGNTFARVFNDKPYDQIHGYTNVNLSLIFTNQDGWQAMAYMKNVFDTTAITGAFLNSDDTGLTTNVFVTDPRLFGLRITKNW